VDVDKTSEEIFGYTKAEVVRKYVSVISPERYRAAQKAGYERVARACETKFSGLTIQFEGLRKDGSEFPVELSYSARKKPDGNLLVTAITRDITDRVKAQREVQESRDFLQNVFKASGDAIMVTDDRGLIAMANEAMARAFGYSKEELVGMHPADLVAPDEASRLRALSMMRQMRDGVGSETVTTEGSWRRRNGETLSVEFTLAPLRNAQGQLSGAVTVIRDASERKRLERKLRESEERHRKLINTANDVIFECGLDGTFCFVSEHCKSTLGYGMDEMLGKRFDQFVHPTDAPTLFRVIDKITRGEEQVETMEYRARHKEGTWRHLVSSCAPLRNEEGRIEGFVGVAKDLTERIHAENEIALQKERLNTLLSSMPDGVVIVSRNYEVEFMNQPLLTKYGNQIGSKCYNVFIGKDKPCDVCPIPEIVDNKKERFEYSAQDKENRHFDLIASPLKNADGSISVIEIVREVTERKAMEARLNQFEKMESLGTLAGGVAHDFNNLLVGILGCASFMKTLTTEKDGLHRYVEIVESSANRAAKLTQRLLSFSRQGPQDLVPLDLNDTVKETLELLSKSMRNNVEIETLLGPTLSPLTGDANQLQQAILNICVNALDAMPGGGKLVLETKNIRLDSHFCRMHPGAKPGDYVYLSVSDTGSGMDKATLRRIFEPFFTT
jgi:PAS domain S-box-containing protein